MHYKHRFDTPEIATAFVAFAGQHYTWLSDHLVQVGQTVGVDDHTLEIMEMYPGAARTFVTMTTAFDAGYDAGAQTCGVRR